MNEDNMNALLERYCPRKRSGAFGTNHANSLIPSIEIMPYILEIKTLTILKNFLVNMINILIYQNNIMGLKRRG